MFELDFTIKNGWVLSVIFLTVAYLPMAFSKYGRKRLVDFSWASKKGKQISAVILFLFLFLIILILPFFYQITDIAWQLITGLVLFTGGATGVIVSYANYFTSEKGKLITKGLYKISRNPIYMFTLIMLAGISVLCTSAIIMIFIITYFFIQIPVIKEEEQFCLENFEYDFIEYKKRTRRFF